MNKFLFYASARWFGEAVLELYICRRTPEGCKQVYLIPRSADDPFYPSMLHMPGARKLPTETDQDHFRRALKETPFDSSVYVEYILSTPLKTKRGTDFSDIRRIVVPYNSKQQDFYDVDNLPRNIIEHHKTMIEMVKNV